MTKITVEQIASARQYFRDGFSVPECCQMASMSRASFYKYLKSDIEAYIQEHEQAKAKRERSTTTINKITLDDFTSYATHEFSNASNDIIAIKDVFYQIRNNEELNYEQVIKLRELYEQALDKLANKNISQRIAGEHEELSSDCDNETIISFSEALKIKSGERTQQTIKAFKSRHNIKIPIPKLNTLQTEEWSKLERVYEHLAFWYVDYHEGRKAATAFIRDRTLESYQQWLDSLH